jgi:hypothetical protein
MPLAKVDGLKPTTSKPQPQRDSFETAAHAFAEFPLRHKMTHFLIDFFVLVKYLLEIGDANSPFLRGLASIADRCPRISLLSRLSGLESPSVRPLAPSPTSLWRRNGLSANRFLDVNAGKRRPFRAARAKTSGVRAVEPSAAR